ncbi:hypothetical protein [Heyndrickxia oleronia]|nr:hypothetical protein [Heyndrickxia oleronia]
MEDLTIMELIYQEHSFQLNKQTNVEIIIEKIHEILEDGVFFSHLIIDGKEVYEDFEIYLLDHLTQIKQIKVITKTVGEFINELLLTAEGYLDRAIPEVSLLSNEFYQNSSTEGWNKFSQMLEGIQWLNQMIHTINKIKEQPNNWNEYLNLSKKLENEIKNLEVAVENDDNVLIADIIQYEILSIFERVKSVIQTTIDLEGCRHDLN